MRITECVALVTHCSAREEYEARKLSITRANGVQVMHAADPRASAHLRHHQGLHVDGRTCASSKGKLAVPNDGISVEHPHLYRAAALLPVAASVV